MKISNTPPLASVTTSRPSADKAAPAAETRAAVRTPEVLSSGVAEALSRSSDVDMNKVNELRQAIAEGRVPLDPERLAEAIVDVHRK